MVYSPASLYYDDNHNYSGVCSSSINFFATEFGAEDTNWWCDDGVDGYIFISPIK